MGPCIFFQKQHFNLCGILPQKYSVHMQFSNGEVSTSLETKNKTRVTLREVYCRAEVEYGNVPDSFPKY